jgi:hypothetical protein
MLIIVASITAFSVIDFKRISVAAALQRISVTAVLKRISVPAAVKRIDSFISFHKSAPSPSSEVTPLPAIHNSPDTECDNGEQCTDEELAGLVESLRRQWAITPEELRSKCAADSTYPSLEQCILRGTVSWLENHPKGETPWINPKNFDTAIMDLCQKDPKSLSLCQKP